MKRKPSAAGIDLIRAKHAAEQRIEAQIAAEEAIRGESGAAVTGVSTSAELGIYDHERDSRPSERGTVTPLDRLVAHAQAVQASYPGLRFQCSLTWSPRLGFSGTIFASEAGRPGELVKNAMASEAQLGSLDAVVDALIAAVPVQPNVCCVAGEPHVETIGGPVARCEARP